MPDNYSLITKFVVDKFMSVEHGVLEFDQGNIISVCGMNDSGKSAITSRAFAVILYDAFSRDQVRFIKEGAEYFVLTLHFDDGVSISKTKYITGVSIWEFRQNGSLLYTNKLATGVQAVSGVPETISQYLGVLYDDCTDSMMNVRRNTDKLFLIDTTGGDNYKVLNTFLHSDVLAKASMAMTQDKNKMNADLQVKVNQFNGFIQQCEAMDVAPEEEINILAECSAKVRETMLRATEIDRIKQLSDFVQNTVLPEVIEPISVERLSDITELRNNSLKATQPIMPQVTEVDIGRLQLLGEIKQNLTLQQQPVLPALEEIQVERWGILTNILYNADIINRGSAEIAEILKLTPLDTERVEAIQQLWNYREDLTIKSAQLMEIERQLGESTEKLQNLSKQYNFRICKNCGTIVLDECNCEVTTT